MPLGEGLVPHKRCILGGTPWSPTTPDNPRIKYDGENPKRRVSISSFYIDKYEVTNEQYLLYAKNTSYVSESEKFGWYAIHIRACCIYLCIFVILTGLSYSTRQYRLKSKQAFHR